MIKMLGVYTTKVYSSRTTIPKDIRDKLKVKEGDGLIWEIVGNNISIKKNDEKKIIF